MQMTEIVVVGAGPAGIGAALAAARNGASVVLIDEHPAPGGHLRWTMARHTGFGGELDDMRGVEMTAWAERELAAAGVDLLSQSVAWGLFEDNLLGVATDEGAFQLQAASVIIASGATDIVWPFPGWDIPGVLTATAALRSLHLDRVLPGRRVAVIGSGTLAHGVAQDLVDCGAVVTAQVPGTERVSVGGSGLVEWLDVGGRLTEVDAVVIAFGRQPDSHLVLQAQALVEFSARDGVFVPSRDETLLSSLPNVYVVGDAAGVVSPARAFAEGVVAGEAATGGAGLTAALERLSATDPGDPAECNQFHIADETLVCRCEEVPASVIRRSIADGAISLNDLKRRTRAGMGICQGIFCNRAMAGMIAAEAGVPVESIVPMTARPPARLVSMAALADLER